MDDLILKGFFDNFVAERGYSAKDEAVNFEHFANYCVISRLSSSQFNIEDVNVGGDSNPSIDGLAIIANNNVIFSKEDIGYLKEDLGRLEVRFVFLQSKTSPKFESGEISKFIFGVKNFFATGAKLAFSDDMMFFHELKEYIYSRTIDMDIAPKLSLYYVSTGKWLEDHNLTTIINANILELKATNLFSEIDFLPIDLDKIKKYYKELKNKQVKELVFDKLVGLPDIDGVRESFIGYLPYPEFIKFVTDGEGNIQKSIFYENVRDFQGYNTVNQEILDTVSNVDSQNKFGLYNNGITIVAKSSTRVGNKFKLVDFQIVNGCQTSHIIFDNKDKIKNELVIPIKLIISDKEEIVSNIIKATNRQTEVRPEAFESLKTFHKKLEDFYNSFEKESPYKIYYERRSNQYSHLPYSHSQIITLSSQIACYIGMFLNEPHSTHRYYGELLKTNKDKLFKENHLQFPYYTSALVICFIEKLIKTGKVSHEAKPFRYHIAMLLKYKITGQSEPASSSKKIESYCRQIIEELRNEERLSATINAIFSHINTIGDESGYEKRLLPRLKAFTDRIIDSKSVKKSGLIVYFNASAGYGFIRESGGEDIFFHITNVQNETREKLQINTKCFYEVIQTAKGNNASEIEIEK